MKATLIKKALVKGISGIIFLGVLLFLPAGTIDFPGAWRMICILFIPMTVLSIVLLVKAPELLEKRLNSRESESDQKTVIIFSLIMFVVSFLLCGFDFRFGWSHMPMWLSILGCIVFLATYLGFAELLRENEFLSRTVEVQDGQRVVSTGLYGIVRHPMYAIILCMFISMPIIIGSFVGLIPLIFLPCILIKRIRNEEKVLSEGLIGYTEYKEKVKYRLIPFIW